MEKNKRLFGICATIASAVMFGFLPLLVKSIYAEGTNTISLVVLRFSVAVLLIFIFLKIKGISLKISLIEFRDILFISVFGFGGTAMLLFSSYLFIPSGMATTIHFMYPMLTMIVLTVILKEKLTWMKVVAQVLCILGIILFYTAEGGTNIIGIILAAASSCTYTFYTVFLGHSSLKNVNDFKLLFYMSATCAVFVLIIDVITGNVDFTITAKGWILIAVFAFFASFVGSIGYQFGVRFIGGQATSILSTFEPVTSVIVGAIVYNEGITIKSFIGCISIIAAAILTAIITGKDSKDDSALESQEI